VVPFAIRAILRTSALPDATTQDPVVDSVQVLV